MVLLEINFDLTTTHFNKFKGNISQTVHLVKCILSITYLEKYKEISKLANTIFDSAIHENPKQ